MNYNNKHIGEIKERLGAVVKKDEIKNSLNGFLISFSIALMLFISLLLIESIWNFSSGARTILFFSLIILSAGLLLYFSLYPFLKSFGIFEKIDNFKTAERVGFYFPDVKDELINSLQLISADNKYNQSPVLIEKAFERTYEKIK
ncbi:MAG: hypothetical protein F9K45_05660, partial [Melioribacteraceae bacterium]